MWSLRYLMVTQVVSVEAGPGFRLSGRDVF